MVVNIMKYLPKSTSFSIPSNTIRKNFSGPIVSIVPQEARGRKNYQAFGEEYEEPTSPKVSCIGQVMNQKKTKAKKKTTKKKTLEEDEEKVIKPPVSLVIRRMFQGKVIRPRRRDDRGEVAEAPAVGNMKRYSSSRVTLEDFDWRNCGYEEEVLVPHSAPILVGGGGAVALEPKKEVNLWKRRTFVPPTPIEVKRSSN